MSFAALYVIYHDDLWLPYSYMSIYPAVDTVYFFLNTRPWNGPKTENTRTKLVIDALPDPQKKKHIIEKTWESEEEQRNFSLAYAEFEGHEYGFIVDADEIYDTPVLQRMISFAKSNNQIACWHMLWFTYWKSAHYRIDPPEPYMPTLFLKLGSAAFVETRNVHAESHQLMPPEIGMCHHMSYARPDELIRRKHGSFGHSHQILPGWFENVWKKWDEDHNMLDLHPVIPPQYKRAIPQPIEAVPTILREVYEKGGLP